GNTWSAWNETTPRHRAFIDAMVQSKMHIIATGRSKTETAQQQGDNGKKTVVKLGLKTEQRDGFEYEFTAVLDIVHDGHWATASKDRTGLFKAPHVISEDTGKRLLNWLDSGVDQLQVFIKSIEESESIDLLKSNFGAAWKMSDETDKTALKTAYDKRTNQLTKKAE
ncbi:MAG: AAA family ATPase, partial [Shewanella sp.]